MVLTKSRLFVFLSLIKIVLCDISKVERLENIIKIGIQNAIKYQLPNDAKFYKPKAENKIKGNFL